MRSVRLANNQLRPTVYVPSGTPVEVIEQILVAANAPIIFTRAAAA